jgi:peptidyl-prolyl cis-trans isomerase D
MLKQMRGNTKIVLWIILIGFMLMVVIQWGIGGFSGVIGPKQGVIGIVNKEDVPLAQFSRLLEQNYQAKREETRADVLDQSLRDQIKEQTWTTLINEILVRQEIKRRAILVTDQEVSEYVKNNPPEYIQKAPYFLKEDSTFDIQKYQDFLNSPASYENPQNQEFIVGLEAETKNMLQKRELFRQLLATVQLSTLEVENAFRDRNEKVKVKYLGVNAYDFNDSAVTVPEAEKKAYYAQHQDEFKQDERRSIEYVMMRKEMTDDDSLYARQQIEKLALRIKNGEDFADLAKTHSADPSAANGGDLGWFTRGAMVKEFADTAFALDSGRVSGPVKTMYGWHLIKRGGKRKRGDTLEVQAAHILVKYQISPRTITAYKHTLDVFRADLAKATQPAGKKRSALGNTPQQLKVNDQEFRAVAQRHGLEVQESGPFTKAVYIPMIGYASDLVNFFFRSKIGAVNEVYEATNGFYVGRLVRVLEKGIQPYPEVAFRIENRLRNEKKVTLAQKLIEQIAPQAKSNLAWETLPTDIKVTYKETDFFSREDFVPGVGTKNEFTAAAFALNTPGEVGAITSTDRGCFLLQLVAKVPMDPNAFTAEKDKLQEQLLQAKQNKVYVSWFTQLRKAAKIKDYRELYF